MDKKQARCNAMEIALKLAKKFDKDLNSNCIEAGGDMLAVVLGNSFNVTFYVEYIHIEYKNSADEIIENTNYSNIADLYNNISNLVSRNI